MNILGIGEVVELNRLLEQNSAGQLHLHDACGAQSFSLEHAVPRTQTVINGYLRGKGLRAIFDDAGTGFVLAPAKDEKI